MNPNDLLQQQQAYLEQVMHRTQQTNMVMFIVCGVIGIVGLFLLFRWLYYTVEHFRELAEAHLQLANAVRELSRTVEKHLAATQPKPPSTSPPVKEPQGQTKPPEAAPAVRVNFSK